MSFDREWLAKTPGIGIQLFFLRTKKGRKVLIGTIFKQTAVIMLYGILVVYLSVWLSTFLYAENAEPIATIYDWLGCIAFCLGGGLVALKQKYNRVTVFICSVSTAFFGGAVLRDGITLMRPPAILGSPEQIVFVCLLAIALQLVYQRFFVSQYSSKAGIGKRMLTAADSLGVLVFIKTGTGHALTLGRSMPIVFLCGFFTAVGGGFCAAVIKALVRRFSNNVHIEKKSFFSNMKETIIGSTPYYIFSGIVAILYIILLSSGHSSERVLILMTVIVLIGGFMTDETIRKKVVSRFGMVKLKKGSVAIIDSTQHINIISKIAYARTSSYSFENFHFKKHLLALEKRIQATYRLYTRQILFLGTAYHRRQGLLA